MPSFLASAGAGAAQGLEALIKRKMMEDQLQLQFDKERNDTSYRNRSLDSLDADRKERARIADANSQSMSADRIERARVADLNAKSMEADRSERRFNAEGDDIRGALDNAGPDTTFTPEERQTAIKHMIPQGRFREDNTMPNGDAGPVQQGQGVIKLTPTNKQTNAEESLRIREEAAAGAAKNREESMNNASERLRLAKDANDLSHDKFDASQNTVKVGEGGKRALRSIDQAVPLMAQVKKMIKDQAPDIETNPDAYNTVGNKASRLWETAKYKAGFSDPSSPRIQLTSLLQPVQSSQYLAGSRNWNMVELAMKHLADPNQTLARQWEAITQLESVMPEMRQAIIDSEAPVHLDNPRGGRNGTGQAGGGQTGGQGGGNSGGQGETPYQRWLRDMGMTPPR